MIFRKFLMSCFLWRAVMSDWVKLPQITNSPKPTIKPINSVSILGSSDVMSRILSQSKPVESFSFPTASILKVSADELFTHFTPYAQKENLKKFVHSDFYVTTTTDIPLRKVTLSDKIDPEEFERAYLEYVERLKKKQNEKVVYMNQTIPVPITPQVPTGIIQVGPADDDPSEELELESDFEEKIDDKVEKPNKKIKKVEKIVEETDEDFKDEDDASESETIEDFDEKVETPPPKKKEKTKSTQVPQRRIMKFVNVKPKHEEPLSFSNFIKFLKNVQQNFVFKTANNIQDKIIILNNFRDRLLKNIQSRIKNLWVTPKLKIANKRTKRFLMGDSSGHGHDSGGMDFPSAEAALLTISFLTFAVFLIKLVLQVINTIKSKHYSWTAQMDPSLISSAQVIKKQRNVRRVSYNEEDLRNITNIINSIEKLNVK